MTNRTLAGVAAAAVVAAIAGAMLCSTDAATLRAPTELGTAIVGSAVVYAATDDPKETRTVIVRNDCDHQVWLFYGRVPPTRPQDAVTLNGRAFAAQPMLEGDVVWLLHADGTPIGSATVGASTTAVIVDASCRSIAAVDEA